MSKSKSKIESEKSIKKTGKGGRRAGYLGQRDRCFQLRASETEMRVISYMARQYTDGDVSKWMRFASMNFRLSNAEQQLYQSILKKVSGV